MSAKGRRGQKTHAGFYDYDEQGRHSRSAATDQIVADFRAQHGRSARTVADQEILERTLYAMINEGSKILEER